MKFQHKSVIGSALFLAFFFLMALKSYGQLTVDLSITHVTCNGGNDGAATATVNGATGTITYDWGGPAGFNGQGTNAISDCVEGTYSLTVREDGSPVWSNLNIVVTQPAPVALSVRNVTADCNMPGGDGGFDVVVSGGQAPTVSFEKDETPTVLNVTGLWIGFTGNTSTTNYQVKVTLPYVAGMPNDFDGVSFLDDDDNPLYYWPEAISDGTEAVYWVLLPELSVGENLLNVVWGANSTGPAYNNFYRVFKQGGLNATIFTTSTDFTGDSILCPDANNLNVLNKDGNIDLCGIADNDAVSIRWEGWLEPPVGANWYGLASGTVDASDGSTLYLNENPDITTTDVFGKVNKPLTGPTAIKFEYYNSAGMAGTARLGYAAADPADFNALTVIPRSRYYYRNMVTNPPSNFVVGNRYGNLTDGTYRVTISDVCPLPDPSYVEAVIVSDNAAPTWESPLPGDYWVDIASFNGTTNDNQTVLDETFANLDRWTDDPTNDRIYPSGGLTYDAGTTASSDFVTYQFNASFYQNIRIEMSAQQLSGTWDASDVIRIDVDYPNNGTWTTVFSQTGAGSPITVNETLTTPSGSPYPVLPIRIYFNTGAGRQYRVTSFRIIADEVVKTIEPTPANTPTCNDDQVCNVRYTDGPIDWASGCYDAAYPANNEFSFVRNWTATDECGKSVTYDQRISVGIPPTLDMAANGTTIFNFCANTQSITHPAGSDACTIDPTELEHTWVITDKSDNSVLPGGTGSGNITDFVFPLNKTLNIAWTVRDKSGIPFTQNQEIQVRPTITATITAPELDNVCVGENVNFTVTPSGGTGSFNLGSFEPVGNPDPLSAWDGTDYTYTRSWAVAGSNQSFTVKITDVTVPGPGGVTGGCDVTLSSEEFDVHRLIETQNITRD